MSESSLAGSGGQQPSPAGSGGQQLGPADLVGIYRTMALTRLLDQRLLALSGQGKVTFTASALGHEGAQVGSAWVVRATEDVVLPYYRDLGVMLTLGMTPEEILLHAFGKADDPNSGGRQTPNHWGSKARNVVSGSSPIGTQIPHATGLAMAARLRGSDEVALCYFGDGATARGDFHEAMTLAGVNKLPVVFVCENNGFAISLPQSRASAVDDLAEHGYAHGVHGVVVGASDPLNVFAAVRDAVRRARAGEGPSLVECKTYRPLDGENDATWAARDPVLLMKRHLVDRGAWTDTADAELLAELSSTIDRALAAAEAADEPDPKSATERIWARPIDAAPATTPPLEGPTLTMVEAVRQTQYDLMAADDRVIILGQDVASRGGLFGATAGLAENFGEQRVLDCPAGISGLVGTGIGLALGGMLPIVEIQLADVIHGAFDQLVSEAARYHYRSNGEFSVPLVVRVPWGAGVHGGLYHSQAIEAFFAHVPGLKVVVPSTPADAAGLLRSALADPDPVLILEHKKTYRLVDGPVPADFESPIGVAELARRGDDLTIITYGLHRHLAAQAADVLAGEANVEVLDLRTLNPLDRESIVDSAVRCGRVLVVHEDNRSFGVGAEIAAVVAERCFYQLDSPVHRLAMPDVPAMPFATSLEAALTIGVDEIVAAARALLQV